MSHERMEIKRICLRKLNAKYLTEPLQKTQEREVKVAECSVAVRRILPSSTTTAIDLSTTQSEILTTNAMTTEVTSETTNSISEAPYTELYKDFRKHVSYEKKDETQESV